MKISIRHRRTYSLAVFCALTSVFLILYGCGDDDNGGEGPVAVTYSISGQVTSTGSGLAGVAMALSGASSATTTTDNVGNYTFTGLDNGSYTITPSKTGFTFSPADNTQTVNSANIAGVNFIATPVQAVTPNISGQVVSVATSSGLSNVTMTVSGPISGNSTTDASGNYTFPPIGGLTNGSYTITPSRTGFTFSPTSSTQNVSGANITGVNFTATPVQGGTPYAIFGNVVAGDNGLVGITMTLSGASSATTTTDIFGTYKFTGLDNGSYTITPSKTGFTFSPADNTQTLTGQDITGVNFAATATPSAFAQVVTCPLSGTTDVTIQDFSFTPQNVTISANGIVKWTNNGTTHTVTADFIGFVPRPFDSGNLGTGATFCVQFFRNGPFGPFTYFCNIHPQMTGSVVVQ